MIESVDVSIIQETKRKAEGKWSNFVSEQVLDPVDLGEVEPQTFEKIFTHDLVIPDVPVSSDNDDDNIVTKYSLYVKVRSCSNILMLLISAHCRQVSVQMLQRSP